MGSKILPSCGLLEVVAVLDSHDAGGVADNNLLIDRCMDRTDSKGTGLWSIVEALNAGEPVIRLSYAPQPCHIIGQSGPKA
eukprot:3401133-Amphidinium_carterae.1